LCRHKVGQCPWFRSGHGVHLYWPLTKALPAEEWQRYAGKVKRLFKEHGLRADPAVTADAARVLRVPSTTNRKKGCAAAEVTMLPESLSVGPYELETFLLSLNSCWGHNHPAQIRPEAKLFGCRRWAHRYDHGTGGNRILPQLRRGARRPGVRADSIYAGLSVLKFCAGGEELAHEWSKGDDRYTREETQRKLDSMQGPHKCKTFAAMNPAATAARSGESSLHLSSLGVRQG
jgi:hypothetical protein